MPRYQFACPECRMTVQSAEDLSGRQLQCRGCKAKFKAAATAAEPPAPDFRPPPLPRKNQSSAVPAVRLNDSSLPPIGRERKFPTAIVLAVLGVIVVLGAGVFAVSWLAGDYFKGEAKPVVQAPATKPVEELPPGDLPQAIEPTDWTALGRNEFEEESVDSGVKKPDRRVNDQRLPDFESSFPKPTGGPSLPPSLPQTSAIPVSPPKATGPKDETPEQALGSDGQIPPALLARLKAATVYIKVNTREFAASGSGFVLRVSDDTALIVTNQHVAVPKSDRGGAAGAVEFEVVFHSGRKSEFARAAELVAADQEHDLAILRVRGVRNATDFPEALNTSQRPALSETTPIFVIGFPFGDRLTTTKGNPAVTISRGTITSLREDDAGDTVFIQIDADSNPGNSGGPVVDGRGQLVGILRGGKPGTHINFAIPSIELSRVLTGRVANLMFRINRSAGNRIELDVRGDLVDPLGRVKSTALRVVRADDLKEKPTVGPGGKWAALARAEKTDFRIDDKTNVSCRLQLPIRPRDFDKIEIYFQPVCVDRDGTTNYFAPVSQTLVLRGGPAGGLPGGAAGPFGPPGVGAPGPPGMSPRPPGGGGPPGSGGAFPPGDMPRPPGGLSPRPPGGGGAFPPGDMPRPPGGLSPRPPGGAGVPGSGGPPGGFPMPPGGSPMPPGAPNQPPGGKGPGVPD